MCLLKCAGAHKKREKEGGEKKEKERKEKSHSAQSERDVFRRVERRATLVEVNGAWTVFVFAGRTSGAPTPLRMSGSRSLQEIEEIMGAFLCHGEEMLPGGCSNV